MAVALALFATAGARAETRTLKLHFIHTKESADITFKRNGRYIQSGLTEINRFLRDWRRNEPAKMDPKVLDLLWEVYRASGATSRIHVVSAYRSPATNSMLRKRSSGVAENSQHTRGKAIDFYIPGVPLATLRNLGLKYQAGGVGFYPRSGSPFVHLDTGNVRHWPRMNRRDLMAVFPNGDTIHVPSDGKPLPNYKVALAAYEQRKRNGGTIQIARETSRGGGLLATLFGGGADEEEDNAESAVARAAPARTRPAAPAAATAPAAAPVPAAPAEPAPAAETPQSIIAALSPRSIPLPGAAPRPSVGVPSAQPEAAPVAVAAVQPALPESLPFGVGPSVPASAVAEPTSPALEMAMNVPLPTARPSDDTTAGIAEAARAEGQPTPGEAQLLIAMAQQRPASPEEAAFGGRANEASPLDPVGMAAYAPVPSGRPSFPGMAAAPERRPVANTVADIPVTARLAPALPERTAVIGAATASPRVAMLSAGDRDARLRRVAAGARTTAKGARPTATDTKAERKAIAVPLPQNVTRWALDENYIAAPRTATEPADAFAAVRETPKVVYVAGFHQDMVTDANRFSGKAVTFMPVAKFQTN